MTVLSIDVGGTFTDLVLMDVAGQVRIHSLLNSARDQSGSILQASTNLDAGLQTTMIYRTPVATHALLGDWGSH